MNLTERYQDLSGYKNSKNYHNYFHLIVKLFFADFSNPVIIADISELGYKRLQKRPVRKLKGYSNIYIDDKLYAEQIGNYSWNRDYDYLFRTYAKLSHKDKSVFLEIDVINFKWAMGISERSFYQIYDENFIDADTLYKYCMNNNIINPSYIALLDWLEFDTNEMKILYQQILDTRLREAEEKEFAEKQKIIAEKQAKENEQAEANKLYHNYFVVKNINKMQQQKIINVLDDMILYNGKAKVRKTFIEELVANGYFAKIEEFPMSNKYTKRKYDNLSLDKQIEIDNQTYTEYQLHSPQTDNYFTLIKTEYDYAKYLNDINYPNIN